MNPRKELGSAVAWRCPETSTLLFALRNSQTLTSHTPRSPQPPPRGKSTLGRESFSPALGPQDKPAPALGDASFQGLPQRAGTQVEGAPSPSRADRLQEGTALCGRGAAFLLGSGTPGCARGWGVGVGLYGLQWRPPPSPLRLVGGKR